MCSYQFGNNLSSQKSSFVGKIRLDSGAFKSLFEVIFDCTSRVSYVAKKSSFVVGKIRLDSGAFKSLFEVIFYCTSRVSHVAYTFAVYN